MKRILITPGEPAGIGPDITIQIAQKIWDAELVVVADPDLMKARSQQLGVPLALVPCDLQAAPQANAKSSLKYLPVKLSVPCLAGKIDSRNGDYVIKTLQAAMDYCLKEQATTIVTGPVSKAAINDAGIVFSGHTEFFAQYCQADTSLMLFVVNPDKNDSGLPLRVALVTTHLPLARVASVITKERLTTALMTLIAGLKRHFHIENPSVFVCGLNPHAGEQGHLGLEEITVIQPVIQALQEQGLLIEGPFAADTIFLPKQRAGADAMLAMYHDQALPVVKYASFGRAVNVTLGLPFLRTSVDHGIALDIAGSNHADPGSLIAAIELAIQLS